MPQLPLTPAPGLFTDTSSFSGKGGWIAASNVRFWEGRWQVIGGWTQRGTLFGASTTNRIHEWVVSAGTSYIVWGGNSTLEVELSGVLYNILPAGTSGTRRWSFSNYGDTLIASLSAAKIYQWNLNTGVAAAQVTNAPVVSICTLVTPQRQLLAFGCNEELSGIFNGRCIRGSNIEDITNWTSASTNNVFEDVLDGSTSTIVGARMVGDYVAVWNSTELWMGTFIGDPGQTYRWERQGSNCGLISLNGAVVVGSTAYWLTPDLKFMAWSPGSEPTIIACPILNNLRTTFPTSASLIANTFAAYCSKFNEVWFTYDNTGGLYLGRYVAFSLTDGHWFKGNVARRAMHQGLSGLLGAYGTVLINCESGKLGGVNQSVFLDWSIQSSDVYIQSGKRAMQLQSLLWDSSEQTGDVTVTVNVKMYPNTSYLTKALTCTTTTTKKDFRKTGRLVSITFSGTDNGGTTDTFARQGQPVFDYVPTGER